MQNTNALKNSSHLSSWRAWQGEGYRRSGFAAIVVGAFAPLTLFFVIWAGLFARKPGGVTMVFASLGVYLAACLALMVFAMLRLKAWKRANPWTPPS